MRHNPLSSLAMLRRSPKLMITFFFLSFVSFTLWNLQATSRHISKLYEASSTKLSSSLRDNLYDVKNSTLGFSRIFVLAMPERTDKRDSFSLAASLTGMTFDWIDGVNGALMTQKALPDGELAADTPNTMGCWRAHMNAWQKMVKEGIPSALIFEDDADWDVMLKSQLVNFAQGTRFIQTEDDDMPTPPDTNEGTNGGTNSPYGNNWDLLWLGHCGVKNWRNENRKYWVTHNDPTAVPPKHWGWWRRQPDLTAPSLQEGNNTRVVFDASQGLCMFGYALSLRGAQRLLHHQALSGNALPSDRALKRVCQQKYLGFNCYAPYPALIGSHKGAGSTAKDSDRENITATYGAKVREVGVTQQLVFSTRLNFLQLQTGNKTILSQWPDDTMLRHMDRTVDLPTGHGVYVHADEYVEPPK